MSDLIERQVAIDAVEHITSSMSVCVNTDECHGMKRMQRQAVIELANLPSAQPERLTDDDFETIRIHLSAFKERLCNQHRWEEAEEYQRIIDRFMRFASSQPEIARCKDCKHHWTHRCMDSMPTEICELGQTFYDANVDFCSLAERRTDAED